MAPTACLALAGCSLLTDSFVTNDFSGDEFPIAVELDSGAVIVGLREPGVADRVAILDVLSPFTVVDPGAAATPSVRAEDVYLLSGSTPRAYLDGSDLVSFHPCSDDLEPCVVGPTAAPVPYQAIIGAQALAGDAVRLRLGDEQIFILPDIGGTEAAHTHACDGVFPSPYRGGGTLILNGTEVGFGGRRIALNACLGANPDPLLPQGQRGTDSLLVMSTSVGVSLLGEAAYERYRATHPTALPLPELADDSVYLPSGLVVGKRATLDNLALVAATSSETLSACRQVYANHFMTARNCVVADDCPCEENSDNGFCPVAAVVELTPPTGVSVLVVPDADQTLQALRTELRPNQAEVDGIIGTDIIKAAEIDVDYPHNRLLARCTAEGCVTRPAIPEQADRRQAQGCLESAPPGPLF
ncbi:MAG: hypothetical protein SFX73_10165 [Kofleriaceae bacterium]|nr:hypothetical protein [Kofleriaceae bacterium]